MRRGWSAWVKIAVDGTKIAANASWSANYTQAALEHQVVEQEALFAAAAAALLDEQAATDDAEDALFGPQRGDELPVPLRRQGERLQRLTAARDRLEAKKQAAQQAQDAKQAQWQARKDAGSKRPGRRPGDTPPTARSQRSGQAPRANTTDPDSRGMRSKHTLVQGYNAQAAVTGDQVIVGMLLTQAPTDRTLLHDVLDATRTQLAKARITTSLHRAGRRRLCQRGRLHPGRGSRVAPARAGGLRRAARAR